MGWFITTLVIIWFLALVVNLYYLVAGTPEKFQVVSVTDCIVSSLIEFSIAAGLVLLTPGTLTVFGTMLVAWYVMHGFLDIILAGKGGFRKPEWFTPLGVVVGIAFITLALTTGIVVV